MLSSAALALVAGVIAELSPAGLPAGPCTEVPVLAEGKNVARACIESLPRGLVLLDLRDDWVPRLFSETPALPQGYRPRLLALANEDLSQLPPVALRDRYFELFGVFPSFSVAARRLLDEARHGCHAAIDNDALATEGPAAGAVAAAQAHLRCDGFLVEPVRAGVFDQKTRSGIGLYQRAHMIPSPSVLDTTTRASLLTPSRELDFRTLLRALRERVLDVTGLIEDGSASNGWEPVLGRHLDAVEFRTGTRALPLAGAAPDFIARATETAARALGWTSPEAAAAALARWPPPPQVALALPPPPPYHQGEMRLRAEIDRGDVWLAPNADQTRLRPVAAGNLRVVCADRLG